MTELPRALEGYRGRHRGETMLVAGCGRSVAALAARPRCPVIGVNDVGRAFDPDYLVVLNPRGQFRGDRFRHVETSRATVLFSTLDLGVATRARSGSGSASAAARSMTSERLPYTRNSPYVALCLAADGCGEDRPDRRRLHRPPLLRPTGRTRWRAHSRGSTPSIARSPRPARREGRASSTLAESRLTALRKVDLADFLRRPEREDDLRDLGREQPGREERGSASRTGAP